MDMKPVCPRCYTDTGFSVVMSEEKGVYYCPKNGQHRFKESKDGFLEFYTP
jgi:ribosomal protein S27AE